MYVGVYIANMSDILYVEIYFTWFNESGWKQVLKMNKGHSNEKYFV